MLILGSSLSRSCITQPDMDEEQLMLLEGVKASRALENMIYENRSPNRDRHTLLHRKLIVEDIRT
jgi:hypothetical protein